MEQKLFKLLRSSENFSSRCLFLAATPAQPPFPPSYPCDRVSRRHRFLPPTFPAPSPTIWNHSRMGNRREDIFLTITFLPRSHQTHPPPLLSLVTRSEEPESNGTQDTSRL